MNITTRTKRNRLADTKNNLALTSGEREKGRGKIYPPTQGVQSVCYINNNYEWNVIFKNCEFKKESK